MSYVSPGMTTSRHDDWETPQDLFDVLDCEFNFTLDAAANSGRLRFTRRGSIGRAPFPSALVIFRKESA